jgi:glutaminyl-tRNA synthetase
LAPRPEHQPMAANNPEAPKTHPQSDATAAGNFIRDIIDEDLKTGKNGTRVATRFPPEPNGYLHIGHAKSICLNFGLARDYQGTCNLRFDDTNPVTEDVEYVDSIQEDVRWLGFEWAGMYYASDYFEQLFQFAVELIKKGKAYVCDLPADKVSEYRGVFGQAGKDSPNRNRSVEENLDLFMRMRKGEFKDGERTLRAKIDMASPNMNMRDPAIYRIRRAHHHRTGDAWCIYPMYDFAHCFSDHIEHITHSICTLEFEDHRPLYDWFLDQVQAKPHPQQIEFARLNLTYTVMSKRKLLELVRDKHVEGWDDPRMPTICGLRRRGYTPESLRAFADRIGVAKRDSVVDVALLEHTLRDDLNERCPRAMGVLHPLKVVIENYPEGETELLDAPNHPDKPELGSRKLPFSKVLYVERDDFMEDPPKKFFRLSPGREVRLRYAYFIKCVGVVKDDKGEVTELRCTYDPATKGGSAPDGRKVKVTIHWVSASHSFPATVRLYDRLFTKENPMDVPEGSDFKDSLNKRSLEVLAGCRLEPSLKTVTPGTRLQLERQGYFCVDTKDSKTGEPVFNRTVTLKDAWANIQKSGAADA